jgi:soluble lytic murein transglycosylase
MNRWGLKLRPDHSPRRALFTGVTALASVLFVLPGAVPVTSPYGRMAEQDLWLVPAPGGASERRVIGPAVGDLEDGAPERALPVFEAAVGDPLLDGYARLYSGRALLEMNRLPEATRTVRDLLATRPDGALGEAAFALAVDVAEAGGDAASAVARLREWTASKPTSPHRVWLRLGRLTADAAERRTALERVYYDFPLTPEADDAGQELGKLPGGMTALLTQANLDRNLRRAEHLYVARRYTDAKKAFQAIQAQARGASRARVDLRLAQCDFRLGRNVPAITALAAYRRQYPNADARERAEAEHFRLSALRAAGRTAEYLRSVRTFATSDADPEYIEEALNDLATHHILVDEDAEAAVVFAEIHRRFPTGRWADRAAWRSGWWAYKQGRFDETIRVFTSAAVTHRRSNYRPSWLYWTARAQQQRNDLEGAAATLRQVVADYRNSYYGRLSEPLLDRLPDAVRASAPAPSAITRPLPALVTPGAPPENAPLVRALLSAGLYADAVAELRRVQRDRGTSPIVEATIAYALNRQGQLRPGITAMRRAYPEFMAAGGEALPEPIMEVIFPIDYWDLILDGATRHRLDPFLMAALIAQESTFDAGIRSVANAWGLMQVIPGTGRRYATKLGIRPFSTARLTNPDVNVRIGMAYFADLMDQFGDAAPALAAYNAGESRVDRWLAERPGFDRDEFVDDIPFPETRNYVKRVLGTAEDYRQLYRGKLAGN